MRKDVLILLLILFVTSTVQIQAQENGSINLTPQLFDNPRDSVTFNGMWKFHPGDDQSWADPGFDDTDWINSGTLIRDDSPPGGWQGIGWYRLHMEVDSTLINVPLAIRLQIIGGCEVFLNGEMIMSRGEVGHSEDSEKIAVFEHGVPFIVSFNQIDNVIAVRISNFKVDKISQMGGGPGFILNLNKPQGYLTWIVEIMQSIKSYQVFFTAVTLILALIHLLMFLFYPEARENLYMALFAFSISAMIYFPYLLSFSMTYENYMAVILIFKISIVATVLTGPLFLYSLFYPCLPKMFWFILAFCIGMLIISPFIPLVSFYAAVILPFIENLRIVTLAAIRKIYGARIIAFGFAAFVFMCLFQMMMEMKIINPQAEYFHYSYLYGILVMLISMSVYLARNFARTNKNLELQLEHVTELSQQAIEQERLAKEQEMRQKLLEKDNAHQAEKLAEAKKLERAHKELEKTFGELRDTQTQLVQSEKMASLGMLVAGVAHEINNPIGAVNSMHNTLVKAVERLRARLESGSFKYADEEAEIQKLLGVFDNANKVIGSGTGRVTEIVKQLKSFAKLDEAELQSVDLHTGLDDTLAIAQHQFKDRVKIIKNYGDIPKIDCFPKKLNQVFLNLLINSCQAISGQGEITITTSRLDGKVVIEFKDSGCGIKQENLEHIFDPGFTTKGSGVGTGLGLSICYQIIQDHKGEVSVESEMGKGTTFRIVLPVGLEV